MGLSNATFGMVGGFIVLPLPQMLSAEGVPELRIAAISAACFSPGFWVFLLGPLLDIRYSRRWYATLFALLAGVGLTIAVLLRGHLLLLEIALMMAYAAAVLSSNALGGWLAGIVPEVAASAGDTSSHEGAWLSAWTQVGCFLGNGLMAGLAGEGLRHLPLLVIAPLLGALGMVLSAVPRLLNMPAITVDTRVNSPHAARYVFQLPQGRGLHVRLNEAQLATLVHQLGDQHRHEQADAMPSVATLESRLGEAGNEGGGGLGGPYTIG